MKIDTQSFTAAMRRLASGVTIVTMRSGEQDHGFTATSFTSLSMDPMLVLVCVVNKQRSHELLDRARHFAVNILSSGQRELGGTFARPGSVDRFAGVPLVRSVSGAAILDGSLAWVDCRVHSSIVAGDHTIFVGEVLAGDVSAAGEPLLYYDRKWGTFRDHALQSA